MQVRQSPEVRAGSCLACGRQQGRTILRLGSYTIRQCSRCLLAWTVGPAVAPSDLYGESYFTDPDTPAGYDDYFVAAAATVWTHRKRLRRLRRLAPAANTLLDVGCGPGFFLREAGRSGLRSRGLDVSDFAARYGRERLDQDIRTGPLDASQLRPLGGPFDLITMWDTLEHLPHPDEALLELADRLQPEGVLSLSTGDVASVAARLSGRFWHLFRVPEHLWFFSLPALRRLLKRAGLEVVRVEREVGWYTAHYLVERLASSLGHRTPRVPGGRVLHRLVVPLTLWDIVTVHARHRSGVRRVSPLRPATGGTPPCD
ncbi:MAG: class I SAM-dependent methyltransferase [Phycisphaerae bacterium]